MSPLVVVLLLVLMMCCQVTAAAVDVIRQTVHSGAGCTGPALLEWDVLPTEACAPFTIGSNKTHRMTCSQYESWDSPHCQGAAVAVQNLADVCHHEDDSTSSTSYSCTAMADPVVAVLKMGDCESMHEIDATTDMVLILDVGVCAAVEAMSYLATRTGTSSEYVVISYYQNSTNCTSSSSSQPATSFFRLSPGGGSCVYSSVLPVWKTLLLQSVQNYRAGLNTTPRPTTVMTAPTSAPSSAASAAAAPAAAALLLLLLLIMT